MSICRCCRARSIWRAPAAPRSRSTSSSHATPIACWATGNAANARCASIYWNGWPISFVPRSPGPRPRRPKSPPARVPEPARAPAADDGARVIIEPQQPDPPAGGEAPLREAPKEQQQPQQQKQTAADAASLSEAAPADAAIAQAAVEAAPEAAT